MKSKQRGAALGKILLAAVILVVAGIAYQQFSGGDLKQQAMIQAASMAGDVAAGVMDRADSERANQLHNVPISIEKINDFIYQARGIGNTHVITTSQGHVLYDTGISIQAARQLQMLKEAIPEGRSPAARCWDGSGTAGEARARTAC